MDTYKFKSVIDVVRFSNCKVCNTFIYTIPCQLDRDFGAYMTPLGGMKYPLERFDIVRIDNGMLKLTSRIGRNQLDVKFLDNVDQLRPVFEVQLAAYVGQKQNILIEM